MKTMSLVIAFIMVALCLGGCVVHTHRGRSRAAVKSKKCAPSHYWDGHKCRHKGKGHGARKHDY